MKRGKLGEVFRQEAIVLESVKGNAARRVLEDWRRAFARQLHSRTGLWLYLGTDWHVFSYEYANCIDGDDAIARYLGLESNQGFFLMCDPNVRLSVHFSNAGPLPSPVMLSTWNYKLENYRDLYICASDLSWTFVLTHERDAGHGPYFALAAWQISNYKI